MSEVRYRKVSVQIWNDRRFAELSDDAQLIFLFLLTHPNMTMLGAMRHTVQGLAAEKGWLPERFREGLQELSRNGMATVDEDAFLVVLPRFVKHNPPANENVIKSWASIVPTLPESPVLTVHIKNVGAFIKAYSDKRYREFAALFSKDFPDAFLNGSTNGIANGSGNGLVNRMPNQEQEQEQEKEQEQDEDEAVPEAGPTTPSASDLSEPGAKEDQVYMTFPCAGRVTWELRKSFLDELWRTYGAQVDIFASCKDARMYCIADERKRKTPGGMKKFLLNWIKRDIDQHKGLPPLSRQQAKVQAARWLADEAAQRGRALDASKRDPAAPTSISDVVNRVVAANG